MLNHQSLGLSSYQITDLREGQEVSFSKKITGQDVDNFSSLSGDNNPLHMDDAFAQSRGFLGRVVHGGLIISYLSKMIGVHLPGQNCLLERMTLNFLSPVYINDTIELSGV